MPTDDAPLEFAPTPDHPRLRLTIGGLLLFVAGVAAALAFNRFAGPNLGPNKAIVVSGGRSRPAAAKPGPAADPPTPAPIQPPAPPPADPDPKPADPPSPEPSPPSRPTFEIGDEVRVGSDPERRHFMAIDDAAWSAMNRALAAKDQVGLAGLIASGRVAAIPGRTRAKILEIAVFSMRVRIEEGDHAGRSGWLPSEAISPSGAVADALDRLRAANGRARKEEQEAAARAERARKAERLRKDEADAAKELEDDRKAKADAARPAALMAQAKALEKLNPAAAAGYYRRIVADYPSSKEAGEARKAIKRLGR